MIFNKKLIYKIIDNKIDTLKLYYLDNQELNTLYSALKLNYSLKRICLNHTQIENITLLCKSLENNSCLQELDLCDNQIEDISSLKFLSNSCLKKNKFI